MATTYKEAKDAVARLRTDVAPEFQPEISKLADIFDGLLDGAAKGGRTRAKKLSKKRRTEIAKNAAEYRWGKLSKLKAAKRSSTERKKK